MNEEIEKQLRANLDDCQVETTDLAHDGKATCVFTLYDVLAHEHGHPVCAASAALVVASIMGQIKTNPASPYATRPKDFMLYYTATYCPTHGTIVEQLSQPYFVGYLHELIEILTPDDIKSVLESVDRLYNSIMNKDHAAS